MIRIEQGDITQFTGDAIVNAANDRLQLGSGVAGAIRARGGPTVQQECNEYIRQHGAIGVGDAAPTRGGDLHVRWVIHAATMGDESASVQTIERATAAALRVATELGVRSVAFPVLGSGVGGVSFHAAARRMLVTIRRHVEMQGEPEDVVIYGFTDEDARELRALLD